MAYLSWLEDNEVGPLSHWKEDSITDGMNSFENLSTKVDICNLSEEFLEDFQRYMEESIRQSRINEARAIESARHIIIF